LVTLNPFGSDIFTGYEGVFYTFFFVFDSIFRREEEERGEKSLINK